LQQANVTELTETMLNSPEHDQPRTVG